MKRILSPIHLVSLAVVFLFAHCDKESDDKYDFAFPTIVKQWQSALEAMQQDGTYDAIHRKWFP